MHQPLEFGKAFLDLVIDVAQDTGKELSQPTPHSSIPLFNN
jgi:hypothetical protein